jgi:hypothetical protein
MPNELILSFFCGFVNRHVPKKIKMRNLHRIWLQGRTDAIYRVRRIARKCIPNYTDTIYGVPTANDIAALHKFVLFIPTANRLFLSPKGLA